MFSTRVRPSENAAGYWADSKMDDFERLAPATQKRLRHFLDMGLSAARIGVLMDLPWVVVDRIKYRGTW